MSSSYMGDRADLDSVVPDRPAPVEIPADYLPSTSGYGVECDAHRHTVGYITTDRNITGRRIWHSFNPCGDCPCPAGGDHEWGVLEQAGTGHTWAGCENCGASRPPEEDLR